MKCAGIFWLVFLSTRWPVSIGCVISTRTSIAPSCGRVRTFIFLSAMISFLLSLSRLAAATADGDLDGLLGAVELAAGLAHHVHVRGLAHLHARGEVAVGAMEGDVGDQ